MNEKHDLAYAMSHVIGYQLDNQSVEDMLNSVYACLRIGGKFIFNFYQESGVYLMKLKAKKQEIESEGINIVRFSSAELSSLENSLILNYYYIIEDKNRDDMVNIQIQEKMRYFSLLEIEYYLHKVGFIIEHVYNFGEKTELRPDEWNACIVATK